MAQGHSGKIRAFLLAFLMATISMSASLPSWEFSTLEEKSAFQTYSTNSTVDLVLGRSNTIPTNIVGNTSTGTFEIDSETESLRFTSSPIESIGKVVFSSSSSQSACAIFDDGNLKCWGQNYYGQLGIGVLGQGLSGASSFTTPQTLDLGTGRTGVAVTMSVNGDYACAILDNGSLKCWGRNNYGQIGNGGIIQSDARYSTPQNVDLGTGRTAVSVETSYSHTCAILDDGSLKCWGNNGVGQLGIASTTNQNTPQTVNLGTGRTAISLGIGYYSTCAILDDGSLKCWGSNNYGALGIG